MTLVMRSGPGAIVLPTGKDWKLESLTVYGTEPVALFKRRGGEVGISFILFENRSGELSARGCRKDAMGGIVALVGNAISKRIDGETKIEGIGEVETTAYLIDMVPAAPGHIQHNLLGFAGSGKTCAEIHISTVNGAPGTDQAMKALFAKFHFDLGYQPTAMDYFRLASVLFKSAPGLAAPYYKSSLDAMPSDSSYKTLRRMATNQLAMSLAMSGDLKNSRAVAAAASEADPEYPMNYYNLACVDAEQGDSRQTKIHLEQAFERRANVLPGERMPDPTKDASIVKLKKDRVFWEWVQVLARS